MSVNNQQTDEILRRFQEEVRGLQGELSQVKEKLRPLVEPKSIVERIGDLEKKWSRWSTAGAIIAACMVAFLGFTYTDIPRQVRNGLNDSAVKEAEKQALASASVAKQAAEQAVSAQEKVAKILEAFQKSGVVGVADGKRLRVFGGSSKGSTTWEEYKEGGKTMAITAFIDSSAAGFTKTPTYFVSLGGGAGLYNLDGASSINSPTERGFRIYLRSGRIAETATLDNAKSFGYYVNWIAVGE